MIGAPVALQAFSKSDSRLRGSFRKAARNGWSQVRLEGAPEEMGYQHGYWLAKEIATVQNIIAVELQHDSSKNWQFFRKAAQETFWPHVEEEYRQELHGIAEGVLARGVKMDVWDIVALNAWLEWSPYFLEWYDDKHGITTPPTVTTAERCSAFIATGSCTKDGKPVMAHNAWTGYADGSHWSIIFDVHPANGHRFIMDGFPGLIHSGDDFGISSSGMLITETTISQFSGFDPNGKPEFQRARKALQYSSSIDDFARIMKDGNSGGYANNWLVGDLKTSEVASLELGLKNVILQRTKDGYFCGSNFPADEKLIREETKFDSSDMSSSPNARRKRWQQLLEENKGKIDAEAGKRFLSDHVDSFTGKTEPSERTLCGHIEMSPRGMKPWMPEFGTAGAVQAKSTDAAMAKQMTLYASLGHSCGIHFKAAEHLKKHPDQAWQKPILRNMPSRPWTLFEASK